MPKIPILRVKHAKIVALDCFSSSKSGGNLFVHNTASEKNTLELPIVGSRKKFHVRRFFMIRDILKEQALRAHHAHKETSEVVFCAHGSCTLHLDDGSVKQKIHMDNPSVGIVHEPGVWHSLSDFSPDCVLLVLADTSVYNRAEYIDDYEEFLKLV